MIMKCVDCDTSELCKECRITQEYLAPDGKYREIMGCNEDGYIFGEEIIIVNKRNRVIRYYRGMNNG